MPHNIEIKASLDNPGKVRQCIYEAGYRFLTRMTQEDTYFRCTRGRLKLRVEDGKTGQLIFYRRPDDKQPIQSDYLITPVKDIPGMKALMSSALGHVATVRKHREVYFTCRTRVHIDKVDSLGDFIELEALMEGGRSYSEAEQSVRKIMNELGIPQSGLLDSSYMDLIVTMNGDVT